MIYTPKLHYKPAFGFKNKHFSTILPAITRKSTFEYQARIKFTTPDNDFLYLDTTLQGRPKVAILLHGLEGDAHSPYQLGIAAALVEDMDIIALNYRGCTGEPNLQLKSYHSGFTEDLRAVINNYQSQYAEIYLVGVSVGGNIVQKYLGEEGNNVLPNIQKAFTLSVPCMLGDSAAVLGNGFNKIYTKRFLKRLAKKLQDKADINIKAPNLSQILAAQNFLAFDNAFTAPTFGYADAADYYQQNSSARFIENITVPTLLLTSSDDPFLTPSCIPTDIAENHAYFHLLNTSFGGHVGYLSHDKTYYYERMLHEFFDL